MSDDAPSVFSTVDDNVATNVRYVREARGLSQDELAQRMAERGFGFTQATIWKIESRQRPVKISEVVALGDALELLTWTELTARPENNRHYVDLQVVNRRAFQAYEALKAAAKDYHDTRIEVLVAVRQARDAGLDTQLWDHWLDTPAERAVIEARVEWNQAEDEEVHYQRKREVDAMMDALHQAGYEPLRPENVEFDDGGPTPDDASRHEDAATSTKQ